MTTYTDVKSGGLRTRRGSFGRRVYEIEWVIMQYADYTDAAPAQVMSYWAAISRAEYLRAVAARMRETSEDPVEIMTSGSVPITPATWTNPKRQTGPVSVKTTGVGGSGGPA